MIDVWKWQTLSDGDAAAGDESNIQFDRFYRLANKFHFAWATLNELGLFCSEALCILRSPDPIPSVSRVSAWLHQTPNILRVVGEWACRLVGWCVFTIGL